MELRKIEILLEKFYEGKSSDQEEKILREYFLTQNVPEYLESDKAYFLYAENHAAGILHEPDYDDLLEKAIGQDDQQAIKNRFKFHKHFKIIDIAAAILILTGIFFTLKYDIKQVQKELPVHETLADTYQDPYKAYIETSKVLLKISENMNKGTKALSSLSEFNKTAGNLGQLSHFNTEMMKLNHISKFDEAQNIVTNKDKKNEK